MSIKEIKEIVLGFVVGSIGVYLVTLGIAMMDDGEDPRFWKK